MGKRLCLKGKLCFMLFCPPKFISASEVCTQPEHPLFLTSMSLKLRWGHGAQNGLSLLYSECWLFSSGPEDPAHPPFFLPKERQYGNQSQQLPGYIGGLLKCSGPNCSEMPKEGNTKLVGTLWALLKNRSFKFQGYMLSQPLNSSQGQGSRIKISDV